METKEIVGVLERIDSSEKVSKQETIDALRAAVLAIKVMETEKADRELFADVVPVAAPAERPVVEIGDRDYVVTFKSTANTTLAKASNPEPPSAGLRLASVCKDDDKFLFFWERDKAGNDPG